MSLSAGAPLALLCCPLGFYGLTIFDSGGPAGSVVAGRLAYADPNLKVMLIEGE